MIFKYKAIEQSGKEVEGTIEAISLDVAISSLQRRNLVVSSIDSAEEKKFFKEGFSLFSGISTRDVVILSRQISTLFEAQVSALRTFRLLATETENPRLAKRLSEIGDDLQGGSSISKALEKHPEVFSSFFINMVRSGEESGKLSEIFLFMADYLDRNYELTSKAKNALIYPAFIIFTFCTVMILMLTLVIPRLSSIIEESGQDIPIYTQVVIGLSNFFRDYGVFLVPLLAIAIFFLFRFSKTERGKMSIARFQISIPYVGGLFKKLYYSRIADNLSTMLQSGIPIIRAIEVTGDVVDNAVYASILKEASQKVKSGSTLSEALAPFPEIPGIMTQMMRVGEESGGLGNILKTLAKFYSREVANAVDTLIDLIEPVLIVALGLGVGMLLASVLIPIYNISTGI